jgi:arylsulfatase A-like enzyme
MIDVFPTLLAAARGKVEPAWKIDGTNVLDMLGGGAKIPERTLFWEWREGGDTQLAAMRGDLKLIINGGNQPEMYNVATDPAERRTIAAEFPQETKAMVAALNEWLATETEAAKQRKPPRQKAGEAAAD